MPSGQMECFISPSVFIYFCFSLCFVFSLDTVGTSDTNQKYIKGDYACIISKTSLIKATSTHVYPLITIIINTINMLNLNQSISGDTLKTSHRSPALGFNRTLRHFPQSIGSLLVARQSGYRGWRFGRMVTQ